MTRNERGQAFIESLFLGVIVVIAITYSLKYALRIQKSFLLDELVEETLICLMQTNTRCLSHLKAQLSQLGYQAVSVRTQNTQNKWILNIKARSSFEEHIEQESELEYDLKVSI